MLENHWNVLGKLKCFFLFGLIFIRSFVVRCLFVEVERLNICLSAFQCTLRSSIGCVSVGVADERRQLPFSCHSRYSHQWNSEFCIVTEPAPLAAIRPGTKVPNTNEIKMLQLNLSPFQTGIYFIWMNTIFVGRLKIMVKVSAHSSGTASDDDGDSVGPLNDQLTTHSFRFANKRTQ